MHSQLISHGHHRSVAINQDQQQEHNLVFVNGILHVEDTNNNKAGGHV